VEGPLRDAAGIEFLYDLTYRIGEEQILDQRIFDRVFDLIDSAEEFVVIDMFLFNDERRDERDYRPLSAELTEHLVAVKTSKPNLRAVFITDEINNFYGAYTSSEIADLRAAGVQVITTRMSRLRDSNPAYSAGWRLLAGWLGTAGPGWLPHLLSNSGRKVTARSYFKLLNFKANHRKTIITDQGCLITSANPHDASSFHSNIAFAGKGPICGDLLEAERSVAAFSGGSLDDWPVYRPQGNDEPTTSSDGTVQLVTEGKILEAVLGDVGSAGPGDRVDVAMFYLSERKVVEALLDAEARGASVRLVLDPNKDSFGRQKKGIPNRQVAGELVSRSDGRIPVRWYDTHGEQFHTKMIVVTRPDSVVIIGGSANLTRRNVGDYNLEADVRLVVPLDAPMAAAVTTYFERVFSNEGGEFTLPLDAYPDDAWYKRVLYRVEEFTGFCSF
jgi:phosphatidylserine/phosphatidylglycerophosphate/cardiolipin synthase-like enzyme